MKCGPQGLILLTVTRNNKKWIYWFILDVNNVSMTAIHPAVLCVTYLYTLIIFRFVFRFRALDRLKPGISPGVSISYETQYYNQIYWNIYLLETSSQGHMIKHNESMFPEIPGWVPCFAMVYRPWYRYFLPLWKVSTLLTWRSRRPGSWNLLP